MTKARQTLGQRIAPARFIAFLVIFAVAFGAMLGPLGWTRALMTGFDIAGIFFMISLIPVLTTHGTDAMKRYAEENDANRVVLLVITSVVMLAILTAVFSELGVKGGGGSPKALIVGTLAVAWIYSNTVYALHYAHLYYVDGAKGGLNFSGKDDDGPDAGPEYSDFIYFSYTLGMTFQTSDTGVTSRHMRKIVTAHSLAAFVFNIGVLAFSINVLGGG
ncbi:DUF1345 domain-containing protein [Sphingomonas paeninsulae]|uniref:DUF1345 domain-containing protein n=1 Tax=Sphingomonas paeninsulae TaxID=2319844 RepID=A0A494TH68_SPHPE|nr:DUF1345 domain-containing protein [Sphingomonas paeninsulae]AYJ86784.1 DUF1345 domain-containing protein [Sphingomonas paeninsulae]